MLETMIRIGSVTIITMERMKTTSINIFSVGKGSAVWYFRSAFGHSARRDAIFFDSSLLGRLSRIPRRSTLQVPVAMAAL